MSRLLSAAIIIIFSTTLFAGTVPPPQPDTVPAPDSVQLPASDSIPVAAALDAEADSIGWEQLSMQGKLSLEGLPVSPAVKIYMKRGETLVLSARAPIFGEVARLEVCQDSVTLINKHSKKFWSRDIRQATQDHPSIIADLQDLLLGNIVIPGHGPLTPDLQAGCRISETVDGNLFIYPGPDLQYRGLEYGFVASPEDFALQTVAVLIPDRDAVVSLDYLFGDKGWTLALGVDLGKSGLDGELQLGYPDYNPSPLSLTNAGAKYSRTDLKQLLKF